MKNDYPKCLYAPGGEVRTVRDAAEHSSLGPGWYESPADIPTAPEPRKGRKK